jgi:ribosomal 30S subunit maturation factor RimM
LPDPVRIGFVVRTHGLRGLVIVRLELVAPAVALPAGFGLLTGGRRLVVESSSVRGRDSLLTSFEGVGSLESAEELCGEELSVLREDLPGVPGLVPIGLFTGFRVIWKRGEGSVAGADVDSANTLLRIEHEGKEFPLPLAMVLSQGSVDWQAGELRLDLPEGLSDLEGGF